VHCAARPAWAPDVPCVVVRRCCCGGILIKYHRVSRNAIHIRRASGHIRSQFSEFRETENRSTLPTWRKLRSRRRRPAVHPSRRAKSGPTSQRASRRKTLRGSTLTSHPARRGMRCCASLLWKRSPSGQREERVVRRPLRSGDAPGGPRTPEGVLLAPRTARSHFGRQRALDQPTKSTGGTHITNRTGSSVRSATRCRSWPPVR
jgi:hypothetical protein